MILNDDPVMQMLVSIQGRVLDPSTPTDELRDIAIMVLELAEKDQRLIDTLHRQNDSYKKLSAAQEGMIDNLYQLTS